NSAELPHDVLLRRRELPEGEVLRARVSLSMIAGDIRRKLPVGLAERYRPGACDDVIGVFVVLAIGDEESHVMQKRRRVQHRGEFFRQLVQTLELVKEGERKLAYLIGVGRVVVVFFADLLERLRLAVIFAPGSVKVRKFAAQEIDHEAVA